MSSVMGHNTVKSKAITPFKVSILSGQAQFFSVSIPHRQATNNRQHNPGDLCAVVSIPHRQANNTHNHTLCSIVRQFQFLIGRLITCALASGLRDYRSFQFLIGRLITRNEHVCEYKSMVSIPHRQANNEVQKMTRINVFEFQFLIGRLITRYKK